MNWAGIITTLRRPHWAAAGLLLALSLIYLWPVLAAPAGQGLNGMDTRGLFYPWLSFARDSLYAGRLPLWDPYQFSGYPFLANPQLQIFYPPAWSAFLGSVPVGLTLYVVFHVWLAGFGMLLFVRRLGGSWSGGLLAGLTFAFSGFAAARISAGHLGLFAASAWTPWILLAYHWGLKRGSRWAMLVSGLPLCMAALTGHLSTLLYVGLIWLGFALYLALKREPLARVALGLLIGLGSGLALSAVALVPALQLTLLSVRTADAVQEFGSRWSFPPIHLVTLLNPIFFGGPERIGYWSVENFPELTFYVGALPILAIPLALRKPTSLTWLYLGLGVFGLLLAMGTYSFLYPLLYSVVPLLHLTRAPARAGFLFVFGASALVGDTFSTWETAPADERAQTIGPLMGRVLTVIAVLGTITLIATQAVFAIFHPSDTGGRLWHEADGWAWAMVVFLAGGALLWRSLAAKPDSAKFRWGLVAPLAVLVIIDLWSFGLQLIGRQPLVPAAFWTDAARITAQAPGRVVPWAADLEIQNDGDLTQVSSSLGYNTLELSSYSSFAEGIGDPRSKIYDVLSVAYVLARQPLESQFMDGERGLTLIAHTDSVWVYQRPRSLPLARLVYQAEVVPDPAQARARVEQDDFRPRTTAILPSPAGCALGPQPAADGTVVVAEHRPDTWKIETDSAAPGLLVVSEAAYPGWRVLVDGQPAQPLTAYVALRAVCVPAGKHQVEWLFQPTIFLIGGGISLAAAAMFCVAGFRLRQPAKPVE